MKNKFKLIFFLILATTSIFSEEEFKETKIIATVKAESKGVQKTITSKINRKKIKNKIELSIKKFNNGNIQIISNNFKLGKMPFSSFFSITVQKDQIVIDKAGNKKIENAKGFYKVLTSKTDAFFTGEFSEKNGSLILKVTRKKKTLTLEISY